jgi:hypothetical protein
MHTGRMVFAQLTDWIHPELFARCVARYGGDRRVRSFSCWDQLLCLAFAQMTYRESLADIEVCLRSLGPMLYHLGIRGRVSVSTLADANRNRDWRIFAELAMKLIAKARRLYASEDLGLELKEAVYALDSTTIELCLSVFPWARFVRTKGAVKLHTLLELRGPIPAFLYLSDGKMADVNVLDQLVPEPGAFYVMDRGYLDFARLYRIHAMGAFFVLRSKCHIKLTRLKSAQVDRASGVRCDQVVWPRTPESARNYPERLRRVRFKDPETGKSLVFLTDNFDLPALTIAALYKSRWKVELFFRWIKGHLRIKRFFGTSPNAVKVQIWTAICVYVLVAIIRKELRIKATLHQILQILSVNCLSKVPLTELLKETGRSNDQGDSCNQLILNGF